MNKSFFIAGTDTDVGKTVVAAGLLQAAQNLELSCYGLKPLAAGAYEKDGELRNEDADMLIKHSSVKLSYAQVNPVVLKQPKAPHLAALEEGRSLDVRRLEGLCRGTMMTKADFRLIEGVGGWRTPLNARDMMSELPKRLKMPVVLVVGMRLGCLNHSLLTAEAIIGDGLHLAGWVANVVDPNMLSLDDNVNTLQALLPAPMLGRVEWQDKVDIHQVADCLDLSKLSL